MRRPLSGKLAVVGNALVVGVGDQVEDVFFEVGAGAADEMNFVLANHFSE